MAQERTVMFQLPSVLSGTLACIAGSVAGRSWDLSAGTFVIGRLESADLHLPNEPGVSKTHAKIVAEGEHYVLIDCESRNGTIVNGAPVQRQVLADGDEIRVCGCVLRFTARGASGTGGVKIRNVDTPTHDDPPEPRAEARSAPGAARAAAPAFAPPAFSPVVPPMPDDRSVIMSAPQGPPRGRVMAMWYAGGLVGSLLFGGALSAVLVLRAPPAQADVGKPGDKVAAADKADKPDKPTDKPSSDKPSDKPADKTADPPGGKVPAAASDTPPTDAATTKPDDAKPVEKAEVKAPDKVAEKAEEKVDDKADDPAPEKLSSSASSKRHNGGGGGRNRRDDPPAATPTEESSDGGKDGKAFSASVEGGKSETLRAKGGKVKSVEVKDGDTVTKGQVLVNFDDGDNAGEIATLRDRIGSLEGVDDDNARRDLKAAKEKLAALQGNKGGPILAGMAGKLTGFSVSEGAVLKAGEQVGRIVDGETPKKVRVNVDRNTRVRKGQSATLVLRRGGEGQGTVSNVNGRAVTVDTGELSGDEVESVRF